MRTCVLDVFSLDFCFIPFATIFITIFVHMHRKSSTKCENNKRSDILCAQCTYVYPIHPSMYQNLDITVVSVLFYFFFSLPTHKMPLDVFCPLVAFASFIQFFIVIFLLSFFVFLLISFLEFISLRARSLSHFFSWSKTKTLHLAYTRKRSVHLIV